MRYCVIFYIFNHTENQIIKFVKINCYFYRLSPAQPEVRLHWTTHNRPKKKKIYKPGLCWSLNNSQSQGSVERANQNMLITWMKINNCKSWSKGLRFVQLMKNRVVEKLTIEQELEEILQCCIKLWLNKETVILNVSDKEKNNCW